MTTFSKPFQSAYLMIREGIAASLLDVTQGPILIAALRAALGLPHKLVDEAGATVTLGDGHNGAIVELLAADTVVTLPPQDDHAWPDTGVVITLRSEFPFTIVTGTGVTVNTETEATWNCEAWPNAVVLHRRSENLWGGTGALTVAP